MRENPVTTKPPSERAVVQHAEVQRGKYVHFRDVASRMSLLRAVDHRDRGAPHPERLFPDRGKLVVRQYVLRTDWG